MLAGQRAGKGGVATHHRFATTIMRAGAMNKRLDNID